MECRIYSLVPEFPAVGPGWRTLPGPDAAAIPQEADVLLLPAAADVSSLPRNAWQPLLLWLNG